MKKKKFIFLVAILAFNAVSWAQITQNEADSIVLERMSTEMRQHTVYAQTNSMPITTSAGELVELDYPCWIYYIHYADQENDSLAPRRYLVVKESRGNVLEVRTKNNAKPDLAAWRKITAEPRIRLSWTGTLNGEHYPLDSAVITNKTNGQKVVSHYPDTVYVNDETGINNIPFHYGDTLIMQGFINKAKSFQYKEKHIITLTKDTIITFAFFYDTISICDTIAIFDTITTTDYSLGAGCDWIRNYVRPDIVYYNDTIYEPVGGYDTLHIINSENELLANSSCVGVNVPNPIDFNQYTLLFVCGATYGWSYNPINSLVFCSDQNQYNLNICIRLTDAGTPRRWIVALLVDKLNNNSKVKLKIIH